MDLKQIIKDVHENAVSHGWWDDYKKIDKQLRWVEAYYNDCIKKISILSFYMNSGKI